jgi:hypothetical protein
LSFCVNCGVRLAPSERQCPLCDVFVNNPVSPWTESAERPYPRRVETIIKKNVDAKFTVVIISISLIIPAIIPMLTDLFITGGITWSRYVLGALFCLFVFIPLPLMFKRPNKYLFWLLDTLSIAGYVFLIYSSSNSRGWYFSLALPIIVSVALGVLITMIITGSSISSLKKAAAISAIIGLVSVSIDLVINFYLNSASPVHWSVFVVSPLLVFSLIFHVIDRKVKLKEELRKRLFY